MTRETSPFGEAVESGGAAFENVGVRGLRIPGQIVEGGQNGDFAGESCGAPVAGENLAKKRTVSARASAR